MRFDQRRKVQIKGFTLTEAAIVLGIVGLILGAIWVAAASVYSNLRVKQTSEELLQVAQAVRSLYATSTTVDPAITAVNVARAGGFPSDMLDNPNNPTTVRDVWGGDVTMAANTINGVANAGFTIAFSSVPQSACVQLVLRNSGVGRDSGLVGITNAVAGVTNTVFPLTMAQALAVCNNVAGANIIAFTFRLRN